MRGGEERKQERNVKRDRLNRLCLILSQGGSATYLPLVRGSQDENGSALRILRNKAAFSFTHEIIIIQFDGWDISAYNIIGLN